MITPPSHSCSVPRGPLWPVALRRQSPAHSATTGPRLCNSDSSSWGSRAIYARFLGKSKAHVKIQHTWSDAVICTNTALTGTRSLCQDNSQQPYLQLLESAVGVADGTGLGLQVGACRILQNLAESCRQLRTKLQRLKASGPVLLVDFLGKVL